MRNVISFAAALALFLVGGGIWGIYTAARNFGTAPTLIIIGGIGLISSIIIIILGGSGSSTGKSIKKPVLSALVVFTILFTAICLFEGLLYDIYLLISLF